MKLHIAKGSHYGPSEYYYSITTGARSERRQIYVGMLCGDRIHENNLGGTQLCKRCEAAMKRMEVKGE